jgi:hypothetical protein
MRQSIVVSLCFFAVSGCIRGSDVDIRNPLTAGTVDSNVIVKGHEHTEDTFGLPLHALDDEARLVSVDGSSICVAVTLRETDPISLKEMHAELGAPSVKAVEPNDVREEGVTATTHEGRLPMQERTGSTSSCTKRDDAGNCLAWDTQPTYATTYVAGAIDVYEARGQVCFPNSGLVTNETKQLTLEIEVRRRAPLDGGARAWTGWGGGGTGSKEATFRWGFRPGPAGTPAAAPEPPAAPSSEAVAKNAPAPAPAPAAPPKAKPRKAAGREVAPKGPTQQTKWIDTEGGASP